jgi:hypothetical protein
MPANKDNMKARTVLIIGFLALLAASCIPSLFPLYTEKDLVTDDRLTGTWDAGDDGIWIIERLDFKPNTNPLNPDWTSPAEQKSYRLKVMEQHEGDTLSAEFVMHMLVLGGRYYLNYFPSEYTLDHEFLSWFMIEANNFSRVTVSQDSLVLNFFNPSYLRTLIDQNRIRIAHIRHDNGILITAPTRDLQKFMVKYGNEKDFLLSPDILKRI